MPGRSTAGATLASVAGFSGSGSAKRSGFGVSSGDSSASEMIGT